MTQQLNVQRSWPSRARNNGRVVRLRRPDKHFGDMTLQRPDRDLTET